MSFSWDENKRLLILRERGLDFADAYQIFEGVHVDEPDQRYDYGETRVVTFGFLTGRICAVVWTPREERKHLISLRKANDREQKKYKAGLG
jgi:uncharacterized protein